jgi:hypothetical protein
VKRTGVPQVGMAIRPCWLLPTLPAAQPSDPFRSKQRGSRTCCRSRSHGFRSVCVFALRNMIDLYTRTQKLQNARRVIALNDS